MPIGTALLQPYGLGRDGQDPLISLGEDVLRLAAILAEDASAGGPIAEAMGEGLQEAVGALLADLSGSSGAPSRMARVETRLAARLSGLLGYLNTATGSFENIGDDPAELIGLLRQLLGLLGQVSGFVTLPRLREEVGFVKSLIEEDLGLTPDVLAGIVADALSRMEQKLAVVPAPLDGAVRRRRNLARATLARLRLASDILLPPAVEVEPIARHLHGLLQTSGITDVLEQVACALDGIEAALAAAQAAGSAAVRLSEPINAAVPLVGEGANYSYYASWLLKYIDLPLYGRSDVENAEAFVTLLKDSDNAVLAVLRARMDIAVQGRLEAYSGGAPDEDLLLSLLAEINNEIQTVPILTIGGEALLPDDDLTEDITKLRDGYEADQALMAFNRTLLDHLLGDTVDSLGSARAEGRYVLNVLKYPQHQVIVTSDGKYILCDDKPLMVGTDLKWDDAPLFAGQIAGGTWFEFKLRSPKFCEVWSQVIWIAADLAKGLWHTLMIMPGHQAQNAVVCAVEYSEIVLQILLGKPLSALGIEEGKHLRRWVKSLESFAGLKGISTMFSTLQGIQTEAPTEKFRFWLTLFAGDVFRTLGPIMSVNAARDFLIGSVALTNQTRGGLSPNAAHNYRLEDPFLFGVSALSMIGLVALYPRDDYSVEAFGAAPGSMFGYWFGAAIGFGTASALVGSALSSLFSGVFDVRQFFYSIVKTLPWYVLPFPIFLYIFKENANGGGTYRAGGGSFPGYPDRGSSPYLLPYPGGTAHYAGQANLGMFSHNFISSPNIRQIYAYDFGHDLGDPVACSRAGRVWQFVEGNADGNPNNWNFITIVHDPAIAAHDTFDGTFGNTFMVYGHLRNTGVTNAPFFAALLAGGGTITQENTGAAGSGTPVPQGAIIGLAGDTGISFHNHLHVHLLGDNGAGRPGPLTIPFVYNDAREGQIGSNGNLQSRRWYRSGNT